mgnify:CR=1 FL=1|tara:strand:- start:2171 stop:2521 length:351 start_codon:yes stop_codon:yes gene_type:complete
MNKGEWGKVRAFFSVRTEEGFIIKGLKLIEGINGNFVGFPSEKGKDGEYRDTILATKELREKLTQFALKEYGGDAMHSTGFESNAPNDFYNSTPPNNEQTSSTPRAAEAYDDDIPF